MWGTSSWHSNRGNNRRLQDRARNQSSELLYYNNGGRIRVVGNIVAGIINENRPTIQDLVR